MGAGTVAKRSRGQRMLDGIVGVAWIAFFVAWYLLGIPLGPGAPVHLP